MFEKVNEVDEKIGDIGRAVVDIRPNLTVMAGAEIAFKRDLLAQAPGALKIRAALEIECDSDPLALAAYGLGKAGDNPIVKFIAQQLANYRAGNPVDPAIVAAANAQAALEAPAEQKA